MIFFTPDDVHINRKNFTSLIEFLSKNKHSLYCYSEDAELKNRFGNYINNREKIIHYINEYSQYPQAYLNMTTKSGINLFDVCRAELLSYVITQEKFFELGKDWTREELFNFVYNNFFIELIDNIAAAAYWIDKWEGYIKNNKIDFALIFSGSLTYTKTLCELLKKTQTRVFVCESYFSGNDFYLEERFSSISNNSLLKYSSYYDNINIDNETFDKDYIKAINKFLLANNLNLVQPVDSDKLLISKKTVAIIGQVVNDFSLLEYKELGINSILIYEDIINELLKNTDYDIIFKGHPWEHKKNNLKSAFTLTYLKNKFSSTNRVRFVDDYNIIHLYSSCKHIILLNSQAGIEAAWNGIKPITLANPFYGNKNFTTNINYKDTIKLLEHIMNNTSTLEMNEYDDFIQFLIKSFQYHLISKFPSGEVMLRKIFSVKTNITLARKKIEPSYNGSKNKDKIQTSPNDKIQTSPNDIINNIIKYDAVVDRSSIDGGSFCNRLTRKSKKLFNNPKRFFMDSNYALLRKFSKLF